MNEMQQANNVACDLLQYLGFDGSFSGHSCEKAPAKVSITVLHLQEQLQVLANASTPGAVFDGTGSEHFTSDDMFKAVEIPVIKEKIVKMEEEKSWHQVGRKGKENLDEFNKCYRFDWTRIECSA